MIYITVGILADFSCPQRITTDNTDNTAYMLVVQKCLNYMYQLCYMNVCKLETHEKENRQELKSKRLFTNNNEIFMACL
jgi:hypothetical protein